MSLPHPLVELPGKKYPDGAAVQRNFEALDIALTAVGGSGGAHAASHATGGTDPLSASAIDAVPEATLAASGKGYVNHGAVAGTARPTEYASIEWVGSVTPTNAINGDSWIDTT